MGITTTLAKKISNYDDPSSIGSRLRAERSKHLLALLDRHHERSGSVSVIDVGGTRQFWNALPVGTLERYRVFVTLVNVGWSTPPTDDDHFRHLSADGCDLSMVGDREFDVCHSNSVIEHVGWWPRMADFAGEARRVAGSYVVQTPYYWFPVEPHFMTPAFHWLPESVRVRLVQRFALGQHPRAGSADEAVRTVQSAHLLDRTMFASLFPDSEVHLERIAGLTKSLIAVRS